MAKCMLNNTRMNLFRREHLYQTVLIDLALNGIVDRSRIEKMLGYEIPNYITPLVEASHDDPTTDERLPVTGRSSRNKG